MSFFAILFSLLIEQVRPMAQHNSVHAALHHWGRWAQRVCDAGQGAHGWLTWALAVAAPALLSAVIFWLLSWVHGLLGFVWLVLMLYFTLGFRQFSHHFTAIRVALESGDEVAAKSAFTRWTGQDAQQLGRAELLRQVLQFSTLASHRHVFGVLTAFMVLLVLGGGPAGAVLYRLAEHTARQWPQMLEPVPAHQASASAAQQAWHAIDALPVRTTAVVFAVVGNFEEALANWRQERRPAGNDALLLLATAGAINVPFLDVETDTSGQQGEPQLAHLGTLVGLLWRGVVFCLLMLAFGVLARLL